MATQRGSCACSGVWQLTRAPCIAFDTQLADIVGGGVVGQLAVFIQAFDVAVVDLRHIAGDVGEGGTVGVVAALVAFYFHAGEAELIDRKAGDLHLG